jgi:transcriptional regulator with GAF, ATPase, and Fis domain
VLERGPRITSRALVLDWAGEPEGGAPPPAPAAATPAAAGMPAGVVPLEELEREMVVRAMAATGDNQTRAAELLGVTRDQLRYRLKKFGLRDDAE